MEKVFASGWFDVVCYDKDGNLKWEEHNPNKIVSGGLQYMAGTGLTSTTAITTWYIGLITGPGSTNTYANADTMSSHAGWTEFTGYSAPATRGAPSFTAATNATPSVVTNSSAVSYTINAAGTVAGAFLTSDSAKSGTAGTLFSESNFIGGDRIVTIGDTLNVTYTFNLTSS
jgi:hypothetical protein